MSDVEEGAQVQEQAPEVSVVGKGKKKAGTGNLIADVASELENLTKVKALNLAQTLADDIDTNSFRLGGVLKVIYDHSWFEGYATFFDYAFEKFGLKERSTRYMMDIYTYMVDKDIPWEKVKHLGWTKLKFLCNPNKPVLTQDNVDEWVTKAEQATVIELQALIKAHFGGVPGEEGEGLSGKTKSDIVNKKFALKADQLEVVDAALSKAKAEGGTEYDNVALELICAAYLGGSIEVAKPDVKALIKAMGAEAALIAFSEVYPEVDIDVKTDLSTLETA